MPTSIQTIDRNFAVQLPGDDTLWFDALNLPIEGRGWTDGLASPFDRLPARVESLVGPNVWMLSHHSAGQCVRFVTDAVRISAWWTLRSESLAMDHMPATGVSGLDLYLHEGGRWRWLGVGRGMTSRQTRSVLATLPGAAERQYMLYLPLYNGIESLRIGINDGATLRPAPPRPAGQRPIVVYGTSIVQGGCASRPGMAYPAIVGRRLDRHVINLGFSGNGPMRPELAPLLAEIDASIYVIDSLPNMNDEQVRHRTEPFVRTLRAARPETPIVLVENIIYQNTLAGAPGRHEAKNAELRAAFARLRESGVEHLHLIPADDLIGHDMEAAVDGTHLTDLGFTRFADAIAPQLRSLLD